MAKNLIEDFIDAIKPEEKKQTDNTYAAEVSKVDKSGTAWVYIAGSERETPTASAASEVKRGDKVQVEWRNNKLYIAGNTSNPSAGIGTVRPSVDFVSELIGKDITVNSINAATGYIDDLYSKNITTENIQASTGYIKDLTADHITAEDISASSGYIKDLTSDNVTAENIKSATGYIGDLVSENITAQNIVADHETVGTLDATYATIANLNAAKGRIDNLEANEAVINDTLKATNAEVEYLSSDWISTDRLVLTGNNKNNYPPVEITEAEFNVNKTAYWTKDGDNYTQCTTSSVYDPDEQYYVRQTVKSIIEAINTANNTDPQVVISNDKLIAASMDVAELSAITADMGTLTAGKVQKGNNFINLNTSPASMEFKNGSTWENSTQGLQFDTQGNLNIKGKVTITSGSNVPTTKEMSDAIDGIEIGGRNLLSDWAWGRGDNTYTGRGVTVSRLEPGLYKAVGTTTEAGDIWWGTSRSSSGGFGNDGNYIFSIYIESGSWPSSGIVLQVADANGTSWSRNIRSKEGETSVKFAIASGHHPYHIGFYATAANTTLDITFRVKLEKGDKATDWTPAPEDVQAKIDAVDSKVNGANAQEQRIYYRSKVSGTVPKPTTWITNTSDKYNNTVSVGNSGWSTKVTPIASGTDSNATKYLYLYTCIQRKAVDGDVTFTDVLLDDSTTVIDGGTIVTGSVTANKLNAVDINASKKLTVGAMTTDAQSSILNSNIEVGGRNILRGTANPTPRGANWKDFGWYTSNGAYGTIEWGVRLPSSPVPEITNGLKLTVSKANNGVCPAQGGVPLRKGTVTLSAWVKGTAGDKVEIRPVWANANGSAPEDMTSVKFTIPDSGWHRYEATQEINYDHEAGVQSNAENGYANAGYIYVVSSTVGRVFYMAGIKLEYGNKATDWTASPDDYVDDADNMLLDWDVPSHTRVKAQAGTYWSDAGNTWITPSFQPLLDPPEDGIRFMQRYVVSTANSSAGSRGRAFYSTNEDTHFTAIPFKLNTQYSVSFWARCTSGSGRARVAVNGLPNPNWREYTLTSDWKRFTFAFTLTSKPSNYYRIWISSYFPANTTGTVEICGCRLVAGTDGDEAAKTATSYITDIDSENGITIKAVNGATSGSDATKKNYIKLNASGLDIYKGGDSVALYGESTRVGVEGKPHIEIEPGRLLMTGGDVGGVFELASNPSTAISSRSSIGHSFSGAGTWNFSAPITKYSIRFYAKGKDVTKTNAQLPPNTSFTLVDKVIVSRFNDNQFRVSYSGSTKIWFGVDWAPSLANSPAQISFSGANKQLWSGAVYMGLNQSITLAEPISMQLNGVVLAWSPYVDDTTVNDDWKYTFIPKNHVLLHNGNGVDCFMAKDDLSVVANKRVLVYDDKILGYANNEYNGIATSGIKYNNAYYVLRYVYGV